MHLGAVKSLRGFSRALKGLFGVFHTLKGISRVLQDLQRTFQIYFSVFEAYFPAERHRRSARREKFIIENRGLPTIHRLSLVSQKDMKMQTSYNRCH